MAPVGRGVFTGIHDGKVFAMRSTIDRLGRIVIPKPIRDRLRLQGGAAVDIEERDGAIEIRPAVTDVEVEHTPEGPVAKPLRELPALTDELVRDTLEQVRR